MFHHYYADMHIHIGRDIYNKPVKISASNTLTLTNILKEASRRKGIDLIGVIDCHAPAVQEEIIALIDKGKAKQIDDGGIQFEHVTLLLGSEIEIYDEHCLGPIHVLCYFPTLEKIAEFTNWLKTKVTNITLSSQRYYGGAKELQDKVKELDGIFIPAHVFTPFKSVYGRGVHMSLTEILNPDLIDGIELGLSSDTMMADQIAELHRYTFLSNSDAHSLAKIAREYQKIQMKKPSFKEFYLTLHNIEGRGVVRNFGMNPKLGKYYTTVCAKCLNKMKMTDQQCTACQSTRIVNGVYDRIKELATSKETPTRPPYQYQVPLEYLPTLGPKTLDKLLEHFQTEMNVIHHVPFSQLKQVVSEKLATMIIQMREGKIELEAGGGGQYGRVKST